MKRCGVFLTVAAMGLGWVQGSVVLLAGSASGAPAAPAARAVTLTCAGVGDFRVVLRSDATPATATPLPGSVSIRTAYKAVDSRSAATVSGGERGDISCGQVPVHGVSFGALSDGRPPAGVVASDRFDGSVAITLVVTQPKRTLAVAAVPGAGAPFPFETALRSQLSTRSGKVSVSMYDATTGATYSHNAVTNYVTASIVKATILATLLRQAQDVGRSLTATERSLATRMIEQSDNSATTALWNQVGRGPAVGAFMKKVGMPSTTPGPDGLWGLTSTNTPDQVRLVRTVAFPNAVLSNASRAYEASLMRGVTPSQKWGVSGGVPASATVALKNGWLPRTGGWVINSIGHVQGGTRNYVIAVLSSGVPGMSYGIKTIEQVSSMVWVSDFSGDGVTDLVARDSAGRLWLYPGNGSGGFRPRHQLGFGWSQLAMIVTPGDVTGDDNADVVARDAAGRLWLYSGNGAGGLSARRQIGSGWRGFTAISRAADLNRAGRPDLLARDSAGVLWLYPLTGNAQFGKRLRIGPGWSGYTILGSGDMSGDARADVLARDRTGSLWLYRGNGAGGLSVRTLVSRGWPASALLFTNGNWDRAGGSDLLARDGTGRLFVYPGNNAGQLGVRRQIGVGWSGMTFLG